MLTLVAAMISVGLSASNGPASRPFDAAARAAVIAPFIDEQTIGVAHVDVGRVNLDAIEAVIVKAVRGGQPVPAEPAAGVGPASAGTRASESDEEVLSALRRVRRWTADFTKAGGKDLYVVASVADLPQQEKPFIIVPLAPDADWRAIAGLLFSGEAAGPVRQPADDPSAPGRTMVCERMGQVVFAGPRQTLERLRSLKPASRPELTKAFEAAGDTAAQALLIPTADNRRVIEETIPTLPEGIGGGPVTAVTRGVMWATLGVDTRPEISMRLLIQSQDAEAAKSLDGVIGRILEQVRKECDKAAELPDLGKVLAALRPTVAGDRLTLSLEKGQLETLVGDVLAPSLIRARAKAERIASMNNMKQIVLGCIMHTADFKGQWPKDLQTIVDRKYIPAVVLNNPTQPGRKDAYVYVRPRDKVDRTPSQTLVVYEAHDTWGDGVAVGFADGHVEFIKDQKRFDELLAKAKGTSTQQN